MNRVSKRISNYFAGGFETSLDGSAERIGEALAIASSSRRLDLVEE